MTTVLVFVGLWITGVCVVLRFMQKAARLSQPRPVEWTVPDTVDELWSELRR